MWNDKSIMNEQSEMAWSDVGIKCHGKLQASRSFAAQKTLSREANTWFSVSSFNEKKG